MRVAVASDSFRRAPTQIMRRRAGRYEAYAWHAGCTSAGMFSSKLLSLFAASGVALFVGGCAHADATQKGSQVPDTAPASTTSAEPAPGQDARPNKPQGGATASSQPSYDASESLESYMVEHFVIVSYARDAVITGHLVAVRRALGALADYKYEHVDGSAQPLLAKMQAAARVGASAKTLEEGARAIASTAAVCGECHTSSKKGPHFPDDYDPDGETGLSNTLSDRMERHVWAANRMWEGLIAPSGAAWRAGSNELASVPLKAPKEKPALAPEFVRELKQLRELGDRARSATEPAERVQIYARFLTTCAQCHERELKTTF